MIRVFPVPAGLISTSSPLRAQVTFSITVRNDGTRTASFVVTDTLPAGLGLAPDSWYLSDPANVLEADVARGVLRWRGELAPRRVATLQYRARVVGLSGGVLRNRAELDDGTGVRQTLSAAVLVRPRALFPWLGAEVVDDP